MITLIVTLLVVGVVLYLIGLVPMDARILLAIRAIVLLCLVLYVLMGFGIIPHGSLPRWR